MTDSPHTHSAARIREMELVDSVCLQYEDLLKRGETPAIADFLDRVPEALSSVLVKELLAIHAEYTPVDATRSEREALCRQHPEFRELIDHMNAAESVVAVADGHESAAECPARSPVTADRPTAAIVAPQLAAGDRLDEFVVNKEIGSGAFGRAFTAQHVETGEVVVIKIPDSADPAHQADAVQRLKAEADILQRVTHPAIVGFRRLIPFEGSAALVTDFLPGQTLRVLFDSQTLSADDVVSILASVAEAMDAAHRAGVIHRDLEPSNIVVDGIQPGILDFGLALHETRQNDLQGESAGSVAYMSPEQIRGDSHWLDGRSDIWAMGVMLYEGLCGRRPFINENVRRLSDEILLRDPRRPRQINSAIPAELERIALKCLSRHPPSRYSTAADLADDLRHWSRQSLSLPARQKAPRRFWMAAILSSMAVVVVAGLIWMAAGRPGDDANSTHQSGNAEHLTDTANPGAAAATAALSDDVVPDALLGVRVIRSQQLVGGGEQLVALNIATAGVLPLRPGDRIQILAEVAPGIHAAIVYLSVDGELTLVHQHTPSGEDHNVMLQLPDVDRMFPVVDGPDGAEMVVLLGDRKPLPASVAEMQFPELESQMGDQLVLASFDGTALGPISSGVRGIEVDVNKSEPLPKVFANQQRILNQFRHRFDVFRTVSFGVVGNGVEEEADSGA